MDNRKILAENIRRYRKAAGLTQEELAEQCGLHRTYIGGIEQERINVSLQNISKIATALDISPALLLMKPLDTAMSSSVPPSNESNSRRYAICIFEGDFIAIQPLDVQDVDLDTRILCALIQDGITDEKELAKRLAVIREKLYAYFKKEYL